MFNYRAERVDEIEILGHFTHFKVLYLNNVKKLHFRYFSKMINYMCSVYSSVLPIFRKMLKY